MKRLVLVVSVALIAGWLWTGCGQPQGTTVPGDNGGSAAQKPKREKPVPPMPPEGSVTIYRDEWGVPHVYAHRAADAAFGLGYAQAEDRLEDIYRNVRLATGTMAEAFGKEHAEMDYIVRLAGNAELCKAYWDEAPEEIRLMADSFMQGVEAYGKEHPEKVPDFACDLYGWQCGAVGRLMILQWPMGNLMDEVKRKSDTPPFGSNAWVVGSERSAEGCPVLLTDPHLTWENIQIFYEGRLHCDAFDVCGFFMVGSCLPGLGHSGHVAWACTTGGPDTGDVYAMKLDKTIPTVYEYDGEWKPAEIKPITVPIKDAPPLVQPAFYTINGPAIEEPDTEQGVVYCGKTPYLEEVGVFEQMYAMVKAQNCEEFYQALAMNQFMEQNVLFADRDGNIQYVRTGRVPIRPEGFDWSKPVPGHTSATAWKGIHPIEDLVQCKNPPQGYFQNCNISPGMMMEDSPMTPDKYIDYIYNVSWDQTGPRGRRALALLAEDDSVTKEDAKAIAMDVYDDLAKPWQGALKQAIEEAGQDKMGEERFATAVGKILQWDGEWSKDSAAGAIVYFWRLKCQDAVDVVAIAKEERLTPEDCATLLAKLGETLDHIETTYGTLDLTWGDIHWIGRGGKYFPCPGADFGGGQDKANLTETLLCVEGEELPDQPGRYVGHVGSESILLSFLHKEGIESYSCVMWGQSGDPESPHYVDQAEKLYAERQLKPTWFEKKELMNHVASETTLTVP